MMDNIKPLYTEDEIANAVKRVALKIVENYKEKSDRCPIFIGILKGSFVFMADLVRKIGIPAQIEFMVVKSYGDKTISSGNVNIVKDIDTDIKGRDIIIVEDILETANTLKRVTEILSERKPNSIKICVLLDKKAKRIAELEADYSCFEIEDKFVVGYGLDFAERYRELPFIGVLETNS